MVLAFDTETRSFRWWENPAFLASWDSAGEGDGEVVSLLERVPRERFMRELKSAEHLVGANAKFDAHMVRAFTGYDVLAEGHRLDDVLTMSRLVYGSRRSFHGLKELATDLIDPGAATAEKEMEDAYQTISGRSSMKYDDAYYDTWLAYPEIVEKYAGLDAVYTRKLYDILWPQITSDPKLHDLYELELQVQTVLYEAEQRGVRVDPVAVKRLSDHYRERDEQARRDLERHLGFVPEGAGSVERLRDALVSVGVELTEHTPTGEVAVNRRALAPFADHPAVEALFEWRRVNKFLTTYVGPMEGRDFVHTNFKQAEAWTGRMSAASPNMQNLPKRSEASKDANMKVRSVFVPRKGMEFIVADFEAIEMRVLAYYLGDQQYRDKIDHGDPHADSAAAAWGGVPEDYYKGTDKRWMRDSAKHVTYSIVYGGGGPVVMETLNKMVREAGHAEFSVDLEQARAIRKKITGAIPGFKALTDSPWRGKQYPRGRLYEQLLKSQEGEFGYVRTLGGRKQWIKLDKSYVALSGLIQGSAADVMKRAAVNLREALAPHGGYPLLFVHDEAVCEVPKGTGESLVPVVVEAMTSAYKIDPPLRVEASVTDISYAHA